MIETKSAEKIHYEIQGMIDGGASHIDALIEYAKNNDMEIETLGMILSRSIILKEKVRREAVALRLVEANDDERTIFD